MTIWAICKNGLLLIGHRVTEWQSDRHPRILSKWVGEIFFCLISINSPTPFAHRGIRHDMVLWLLDSHMKCAMNQEIIVMASFIYKYNGRPQIASYRDDITFGYLSTCLRSDWRVTTHIKVTHLLQQHFSDKKTDRGGIKTRLGPSAETRAPQNSNCSAKI